MSTTDNTTLFDDGGAVRPANYPRFEEYKDAIRNSYWTHDEFNFSGDVQDFKVEASDVERSVIRKTMLAISQIEVKVKSFWGDVYKRLPHAEVGSVGSTFAESEVRHMDAYSSLLEQLGLQESFEQLEEVPAIQARLNYLDDFLRGTDSVDKREYTRSILLFSTFIEHVSLFSQFLIMTAFDKYQKTFKGISNAVEATSKEEQIHGLFGQELVNTIRDERPGMFDESFERDVRAACQRAFDAEMAILDWIFSEGELDFLPREQVDEFLKDRFNQCLENVQMEPLFTTDTELVDETRWFDEDIMMTKDNDFFSKRSTSYNIQSVDADDIF